MSRSSKAKRDRKSLKPSSLRIQDFRTRRYKLPPEAFALGPAAEPNPTDSIKEDRWRSIVGLPDDVSIRTTNYHGSLFSQANEVWGHWITLTASVQSVVKVPREDPLSLICLMAGDEFQASIFFALTGFYRHAVSALRAALEAVVVGAHCRTDTNPLTFSRWAGGDQKGEISFAFAKKSLSKIEPYSQFVWPGEFSLFVKDGLDHFLYKRLCAFSHGRPLHKDEFGNILPTTNMELWGGSNGPIYRGSAVLPWSNYFFDTVLICLMIIALSEPDLDRTEFSWLRLFDYVLDCRKELCEPPVIKDIVRFLLERRDRIRDPGMKNT